MPEKINIAIVGWGNVSRGVFEAIQRNPDLRLTAIFSRDPVRARRDYVDRNYPSRCSFDHSHIRDASLDWEVGVMKETRPIDVAILCGGSATDLPVQGPRFAKWFNTVDSFDTHAKIPEYERQMQEVASATNHVAVISAGWDPGTFSLERVLGNSFIPGSQAYTFWGPGVSQGHSDALRRVPGVEDAIQYTMPIEAALNQVRSGANPKLDARAKHWRDCYVVLKPGADEEQVRQAIVSMPNYFADYKTHVTFESPQTMAERKKVMPHGGFVLTTGKTGINNQASIEYQNNWASNPEATGSILVACARACKRLSDEGKKGAVTMLDIPPVYYSPKSRDELLKDWM